MNQKQVLIVGTNHQIEMRGREASKHESDGFKKQLVEWCIKENPKAIAEEMSRDAVNEAGSPRTVPKEVAEELRLKHKYCDPGRETRVKLGIQDKNEIRMAAFIADRDLSEVLKDRERKRERYWLKQLESLDTFPVFFVCGYCHVYSFKELLECHGFKTKILESNWKQENRLGNVE